MILGVKTVRLILGVAACILLASPALAATINVANCLPPTVQSALNSASTGDIVALPSGPCVWGSTTLTIPSGKKITLRGAGIDVTSITSTPGAVAIRIGDQAVGGNSRVTGFTLTGGYIIADGDGWRVDHVKLVGTTVGGLAEGVFAWGLRPNTPGGPTGLIDNVTFMDTRVVVFGYPDNPEKSSSTWSSPLGLGDANAVYVENSTFNFNGQPNVIDCNYGGRFVFRNNTVNNSSIDAHSVQGWNRGCRRWEVYNNTIRLVGGYFTPMFIRGGTGVIFNNTITGPWSEPYISFDNVRSFENRPEWFPVSPTAPGVCNGSSSWDGNQASNGWPCRDQIGRGGDVTAWTAGTPYVGQAATPAYIWNNTINGNTATVNIRNGTGPWIQP